MATINQRMKKKGNKKRKSKSPALLTRQDTINNKVVNQNSPQKKGVCVRVGTMTPRNLTQHYVNMRVLDYLMEWK